MKGVIIAAGPGEELKPLTDTILKPMLRILDKPLIQYAIERLSANGIFNISIIIGKDQTEIEDYFGNGKDLGVQLKYLEQVSKGIDGSILTFKPKVGVDEKFVLTHCDIISQPQLLTRTLNAADNTGSDMAMAVALQSELQDFGVVNLNSEGLVDKVIPHYEEKDGNYVVAGTFLLSGKIYEYLDKGIPFNECFNHFIQDGGLVAGGIWNDTWIDVGRPWDILRATAYLISKLNHSKISNSAKIGPNVEIIGPVVIEDGVEILNGTIIKGPVYIGKNAFIGNNSLIRECSVISEGAKIGMGVEVRSSVIMKNASIARLSYVGASIIGPCATLHSGAITINSRRPAAPIFFNVQGKDVEVPLEKFGAVVGPYSHIGEHSSLSPGTKVDSHIIIPPNTAVGGHIKK